MCSRYGDRVPKSHIGRLFSIVWFFIGLVTVALLVGSITSSLSVQILNEQFYVKRDKKVFSFILSQNKYLVFYTHMSSFANNVLLTIDIDYALTVVTLRSSHPRDRAGQVAA